jgi:SAM-dependent methyltransferase
LAVGITWGDLPPSWQGWIAPDERSFRAFTAAIEARTAVRVREGEWDHLIYYVLQSRRFTGLAPIEPALSAREYHQAGHVPESAARRIDEFLARARRGGPADERFQWARRQVAGLDRDKLLAEYQRSMKFLYEKEWSARNHGGAWRREYVARLYQDRGHSTDTSPAAAETVRTALSILGELYPGRPQGETLLLGPGLDLAPRTGLDESSPPRSYQMESLRGASCADVNPRIVRALGCEQLNVVTQRLEKQFDLIVLTNVLVYFDDKELALALVNIRAMLKPGGFLIHNELRTEVERLSRELAMPVIHARTMETGADLYEPLIIHQRPQPGGAAKR